MPLEVPPQQRQPPPHRLENIRSMQATNTPSISSGIIQIHPGAQLKNHIRPPRFAGNGNHVKPEVRTASLLIPTSTIKDERAFETDTGRKATSCLSPSARTISDFASTCSTMKPASSAFGVAGFHKAGDSHARVVSTSLRVSSCRWSPNKSSQGGRKPCKPFAQKAIFRI